MTDFGVVVQDDGYRRALLDPSTLLDTPHHDVPERHEIGKALLTPGTPKPNDATASAGTSPAPARADHVHGGLTPVAFTPVIKQGGVTIANQFSDSRYIKQGQLVTVIMHWVAGSASGAAGQIILIELPVKPALGPQTIGGVGMLFTGTTYVGYATLYDVNTFAFHSHGDNGNAFGVNPAYGIVTSFQIRCCVSYWSAT